MQNQSTNRNKKQPVVNINLNVRGLKPSATLRINEKSAELIRAGKQIFKLGLGQSPFPVPDPVQQALRDNAHQKDYLPVKGLPALRESIAGYYQRKFGLERSSENVLVGPGSKELMFIVQLVYYGDLVIPTPSWVSYAPQAQIIGRNVHWLPTNSDNLWKLKPEELELLCESDPERPRLLILNYPNNPTGYSYTEKELKALAKVAKKYRLVLISDEIYGEIHHEGKHISIARYYPEGTIISSGLSKWSGAGGWRLGTFTFPDNLKWLLDAMSVVASETYTSTSAPIQYAAVRAFKGGEELEEYLVQCRRILRSLGRFCTGKMNEAGIKIIQPDGGFYLFPSFRPFKESVRAQGINTNQQLSEKLLNETGVAALPGSDFGRPDYKLTMRMAYVDFDGDAALKAAQEIKPLDGELEEAFLRTYCPKITTAMDRICDWVSQF